MGEHEFRISLIPINSVSISEIDRGFKDSGMPTILEPCAATLPKKEIESYAKILGISLTTNTRLSAHLGVYSDKHQGIIKVVDVKVERRRTYCNYRDPIVVVYDKSDEGKTLALVRKVLSQVLTEEIYKSILTTARKSRKEREHFEAVCEDLAKIYGHHNGQAIITQLKRRTRKVLEPAIIEYLANKQEAVNHV